MKILSIHFLIKFTQTRCVEGLNRCQEKHDFKMVPSKFVLSYESFDIKFKKLYSNGATYMKTIFNIF